MLLGFWPTRIDVALLVLRISTGLLLFTKHGLEKSLHFSASAGFSRRPHRVQSEPRVRADIRCDLLDTLGAGTRDSRGSPVYRDQPDCRVQPCPPLGLVWSDERRTAMRLPRRRANAGAVGWRTIQPRPEDPRGQLVSKVEGGSLQASALIHWASVRGITTVVLFSH